MSKCFSYTNEAFALLMVVNYEAQWTSQHEALMENPHESRKTREKLWKDARYTSSTEGNRRGQSWTRGDVKLNSLYEMVKVQREKEETGSTVGKQFQAWCRRDANLPTWRVAEEGVAAQDELGQEGGEEVEAVGECDNGVAYRVN
jgi:hypothetical protein